LLAVFGRARRAWVRSGQPARFAEECGYDAIRSAGLLPVLDQKPEEPPLPAGGERAFSLGEPRATPDLIRGKEGEGVSQLSTEG
jgi:hypothetical protein